MKGITKLMTLILAIIIAIGSLYIIMTVVKGEPGIGNQNPGDENATIERTATTDKVCHNGVCTLTVYSTPVNMKDSSGVYQPFTDVVSFDWDEKLDAFKLSWFDNYIVLRPEIVTDAGNLTKNLSKNNHPDMKIKEFIEKSKHHHKFAMNYSEIPKILKDQIKYIKLNVVDIYGIKEGELEVDHAKNRLIIKDLFMFDYSDLIASNFTAKFDGKSLLIGNVNFKDLWLDPVIELYDANNENLDDSYMDIGFASTSYGDQTSIPMMLYPTGRTSSSIFKFDLGKLPNNLTILSANLSLTVLINGYDSGEGCNINAFHVYDQTRYNIGGDEWTEDTITWDNMPNTEDEFNTTNESHSVVNNTFPLDDKTFNLSVTVMVQNVTDNKFNNVSILLNTSNLVGSPLEAIDHISFHSKESSTVSARPRLIISYSSSTYPEISNVTIVPSSIYTNSNLNCSARYDSSISSGSIDFRWYKENSSGIFNMSLYNTTIIGLDDGDIAYQNVTIPASELVLGNNWTCSARSYNTSDYSEWLNSSKLTILGFALWFENQSLFPSEYNPSTAVEFNITWNISDSVINTVYIEGNWSGSAVNYTATNETFTGDIYNYTLDHVIGAGTYYWRSHAKSDDSDWNTTDQWTFTIAQNTTNPVHINVTYSTTTVQDANVSTESDVTVNVSCWMEFDLAGACNLTYVGELVSSPHVQTHGVGTYEYHANITGNQNYTDNSTGINITLTITEATSPGGGGGGGGGPSATCGNGFCEPGEDSENCQADCTKENFTYMVLPANNIISRFTSPGAEYREQVSVLNPNPYPINVTISIDCDEGDPSCEWLWIEDDEGIDQKTINVGVSEGAEKDPSRTIFYVHMSVPNDIEVTDYKSFVNFNAFGLKRTVTFNLVTFRGFGILGYIFDIINYDLAEFLGFTLKLWMVLVLSAGIVVIIYYQTVKASKRRASLRRFGLVN